MYRLLFGTIIVLLLSSCKARDPYEVPNPDPNHTHADLAIWIDDEQVDLSSEEYMSGVSDDGEHEYLHKYLHFHDGNGKIIHQHKPEFSVNDFFVSLKIGFSENCLILTKLEGEEVKCSNNLWRLWVNDEELPFGLSHVFKDLDMITITTSTNPNTIEKQVKPWTGDACLYSKRCPWKGDPPTENCIADPAVPCVVPEDEL